MSLKCRLKGRSHGADWQKAADRIEQLEKELASIAEAIHYPDCWDTAAYPTLFDAVLEIAGCSECTKGTDYEHAN